MKPILLVVGVILTAVPLSAGPQSAAPAAQWKATRTSDGHPDLQGTYDIATLTPLERPAIFGDRQTMTDTEARRLETQVASRIERAALPSDGNRAAPPIGGDGSTGAAGNVGGYNNFWIDSGTAYVTINGQKRTSIVVEPLNGRIPAPTPSARQRTSARGNQPTSDQAESNDPGLGNPNAYDDPEQRPLAERCLLGFGSTSGPPALPVLYNNLHQIVQAKDTVMILTEMNHDARIVRPQPGVVPAGLRGEVLEQLDVGVPLAQHEASRGGAGQPGHLVGRLVARLPPVVGDHLALDQVEVEGQDLVDVLRGHTDVVHTADHVRLPQIFARRSASQPS